MTPPTTPKGALRLPVFAVVLAGGYGTRFWPVSRRARPKQFLALTGQHSLLAQTLKRLPRSIPPNHVYVVGNAEHRKLLQKEAVGVPKSHLLLEPEPRNTAAAIALAAEHIRHQIGGSKRSNTDEDGDAILGVFPADHAIADESAFRRVARTAARVAATEEAMVVLGIAPTRPDTGYGYIERGFAVNRFGDEPVFAVRRFTEKPDPRTAGRYLRTRRYFWNAGVFFWRLSFFDRMLKEHLPHTSSALRRLGLRIGTANYRTRLARVYPKLENISVDYALAEPLAAEGKARVLVADVGWSDLGTWDSIHEWFARAGKADSLENLIPSESFTLDASGNLIQTDGKFVAAIGVKDLVVVETPDALLICPRDRAQQVGEIVRHLRKTRKGKHL